jgi:molybdopterin converting factor small subunit
MKVRIYASGYCRFDHIDDDSCMDLPEGACLNDVFKKLGIRLLYPRSFFAAVNYEQARGSTKLKDGDVVSLLGAISGG